MLISERQPQAATTWCGIRASMTLIRSGEAWAKSRRPGGPGYEVKVLGHRAVILALTTSLMNAGWYHLGWHRLKRSPEPVVGLPLQTG